MNEHEQPPHLQLTTDALAALLSQRMSTIEASIRDMRRDQTREHEAVRKDIKELSEVTAQTLEEVRKANDTAHSAQRLATANASSIQQLQKHQQQDAYALAVLPEGGGMKALIKRVIELGRSHEDSALEASAKRGVIKAQWRWFLGGVAATAAVVGLAGAALDLMGRL